jgi:tetratricopeptide (TPR) repeat protein
MTAALLLHGCAGFEDLVRQDKLNEAAAGLEKLPESQRKDGYVKLGGAYFARGDYRKALEYYGKAEDKPGLERLSTELLKQGDYELFLRCSREAGKRTAVREEFLDNARKWNVRNDDYVNASIADGRLLVEKHAENKTSYLWTAGGLNAALDFKIEALITKKSGMDNNAVSVAWGVEDADNNDQFGISGDGHYRYSRVDDGDWVSRIPWTESDAVNQGNASNKITIEKMGDTLYFSVNDRQVATWGFEGFAGDRVAISVVPKSVIEVRHFLVEEYPSARGPWGEIADKTLQLADFPAALKYSFLAGGTRKLRAAAVSGVQAGQVEAVRQALKDTGLSERAARIRLASYLHAAGRPRDAITELANAGWDLSKGFVYPLAREEFIDNAREWGTANDESAKLSVKSGKYMFEKLKEGGSYSAWNGFDLSPDADYRIGASIRKISGSDDETYSIIWGFDKAKDALDFGVTGSGSFQYGYFTENKWTNVIATTSSDMVHMGNASNLLVIRREGDSTNFLVNGTEVGHAASRELTGGKVGFALYQKMAVEIENLSVVEYAPQFALELARTAIFASDPAAYSRLAAAMYLDRMEYQKALDASFSIGDQKTAAACYEGLAAQAEASGDRPKAAEYYLKSGNAAKIRELAQQAGAKAAADKDWAKAVELYLKAGESAETYQGLAAAYAAMGKSAEAEAAKAKLADWYDKNKMAAEALAAYLALTQPAAQNVAGEKYFTAADYESAARLFKASGNGRREKESYRAAAAAYLDRKEYQKALDASLSIGDQKTAAACYEGLAEQAEASGDALKAAEYYLKSGNTAKIRELGLQAAEKAAASNEWARAVELYQKAGESAEAYQGLADAYDALGKSAEAEAARGKLADWYYKNKMPTEALAGYLTLTRPAALNAAGEKYYAAGDYDSAARLFKASGNGGREKGSYRAAASALEKAGKLEEAADLYDSAGDAAGARSARNRQADKLAADGYLDDALAAYKKAGNTAKAAETEKKLSVLTALPGKSAGPGEAMPLNTTVSLAGIPKMVVSATDRDRRVTIAGVERSAVKTGDDSQRKVVFTLRMKSAFPAKSMPVFYFDFSNEVVMFMFDTTREFSTGSVSGSFTVAWKEEGSLTMGYRVLDKTSLQCEIPLSREHYDTGSFRQVKDYDLTGKKGTLTVFIVEGDDVWGFVPSGSQTVHRDAFTAVSNVFQTKVSF